jgi:hypothetical protein
MAALAAALGLIDVLGDAQYPQLEMRGFTPAECPCSGYRTLQLVLALRWADRRHTNWPGLIPPCRSGPCLYWLEGLGDGLSS